MTNTATAGVALDIGPACGALERFRDREIEISRVDDIGRRLHTGVHERAAQSTSRLTAIFGSLAAAEYVVWSDEATRAATVTVPEGAVAELSLS